MIFGQRLKELRNLKGLSQAELAKKLNLSQQTVGSWETNRTSPSPDVIRSVAKLLYVSTDYLLGNTDDPDPPIKRKSKLTKLFEEFQDFHNMLVEKGYVKDGESLSKEDYKFLSEFIGNNIELLKNAKENKK